MANDLQLYREWLGLNDLRARPNFYELLGLDEFSSDNDLVQYSAAALLRRLATVRPVDGAASDRAAAWEAMNQEVELARQTLSNDAARQAYDQTLPNFQGHSAPSVAHGQPTPAPNGQPNLYPPGMGPVSATPAPVDPLLPPAGNPGYASPAAPYQMGPQNPAPYGAPAAGYAPAAYPPTQPHPGYGNPAVPYQQPGYAAMPYGGQNPAGPMAPVAGYGAAPMAAPYGTPVPGYAPYGAPYGQGPAAYPMAGAPMANPMAPAAGVAPYGQMPQPMPQAYAPAAIPAPTPASTGPVVRTSGAKWQQAKRDREAQGSLLLWGFVGLLVLVGVGAAAYKFSDQLGISGTKPADQIAMATVPPPVPAAGQNPATAPEKTAAPPTTTSGSKQPTEGLSTGTGMIGKKPPKERPTKTPPPAETKPEEMMPEEKPVTEPEKPAVPEEKPTEPTVPEPEGSAPPPKPEVPAAPVELPTRQSVQELEQHLVKAKQALGEYNQEVFNRFIKQAEDKAVLPEHKAKLERLKQLAIYAGEYRKSISEAFAEMDGGENFKVGNSTQVAFVEYTGKKAILRVAGSNREYPMSELPPGLGVAVAHFKLSAADGTTQRLEGAYLIAHRKSGATELEKAKELWEQAEASGAPTADLLPLLTEKYELLKDFDALVAEQEKKTASTN